MSGDSVAPDASTSPRPSRTALQTLREALQLFWSVADGYAKRRLLLALVLVAAGALLAALTPIALKLVVDSLSNGARGGPLLAPIGLVVLYALGQYFWRCSTELRMMFHGYAEQRVRRHIGQRLFGHLVRLPLRFHLERKTGAMGETAEQGLRGYDLLLQHLVYSVVPVAVEFAAVAIVLIHFEQRAFLLILGVAAVAYLFAFHRWATSVHEPSERVSASHIEAHAVRTDSLLITRRSSTSTPRLWSVIATTRR